MNDADTGDSLTAAKRKNRILTAAERLFLTYGMRRTSMDDIAREAELAKGTLYLSFKSKDELFAVLAERIVGQFKDRAEAAAAKESDPAGKLVAYLNEAIGEPARLLASTPHTDEILKAKKAFAVATIQAFQEQVLLGVAGILGRDGDLPAMMIEAAHGAKATGALSPHDYQARLRRHVCTLLRGAA